MSSSTSFARRFHAPRAMAGLACAAALAATPAIAQANELERVEVRGRVIEAPVRLDVHAACPDLDDQMLGALARTWSDDGRYGEVQVQMVLEDGSVRGVQAFGFSRAAANKVRTATYRIDCRDRAEAGVQVYRFVVDFVDPRAPAQDTRLAGTQGERRLRING